MALKNWMKVIDAITGVAQVAQATRPLRQQRSQTEPAATADDPLPAGGALGLLEARMAGVVVAALKEAFDRDRARLDLERSQLDGQAQRAERAQQLELQRQAADRDVAQFRTATLVSVALWIVSALLASWLPGMRGPIARALLGAGWMALVAALALSLAAYEQLSRWLRASRGAASVGVVDPPRTAASGVLPWLLVAGFALIAAGVIAAL